MSNSKTYPIVLAHGIARFDVLTNALFAIDNDDTDDKVHYFRNIRTFLMEDEFDVHHTNVDWAGSLANRAADLKREIDQILSDTEADKVHIIAHSMGGLDARRMLWGHRHDAFENRIASVTTLGTPHHGSPFADFLARGTPEDCAALGFGFDGIRDLTTAATAAFNSEVGEWEKTNGVRFRAYAGSQKLLHIFSPLKFAWLVIKGQAGPNDGFVPVASARWNDDYFVGPELDADHLNLIGWWDLSEIWHGVDAPELEHRIKNVYLRIARDLADEFPLDPVID